MIKTSRGTVAVERAGQRTPAPPGTTVEVGDRVRTGSDGYVGITLRDDTLITAGPSSTLLINDFKFNTTTNTGSMLASFLKGTFGVVTGLLAKQSPDSVQFKTPTTSLGIRGTEFLVEVLGAKDE
ncbi:MAG: FecR domain-containing protein [Rhodocyclaceae bacterium]